VAIYEFDGYRPVIDASAFAHPQAAVTGSVVRDRRDRNFNQGRSSIRQRDGAIADSARAGARAAACPPRAKSLVQRLHLYGYATRYPIQLAELCRHVLRWLKHHATAKRRQCGKARERIESAGPTKSVDLNGNPGFLTDAFGPQQHVAFAEQFRE
jgi:hypothetical protein